MTTASPPPQAERTAPSAAASPTAAGLWRAARGPLAFIGALVVLAVVLSLGSQRLPEGDLEPEGPNPEGSRALAEILRERGADVTVARTTDEAAAATGAGSVLVLVHSHRLLPEEAERLAGLPGDRLLVQPTTRVLEEMAPGVAVSGRTEEDALAPRCDLPAAEAAGSADTGGELYSVGGAGGAAGCYPAEDGSALVRVDTGGSTVTVLGTGDPLRNSHLADRGNAALLLNLLAERDVVWFIPDVPAPSGETTLWELLPEGFTPALVQLGAALLLLALWRGRRLGPLVTERIPVVVRAAETTEGRARLYASRRARDRAAAALRTGVLDRIRPSLGLGPDAAPESVVDAVAARTGETHERLRALLHGVPTADAPGSPDPFTGDDATLVRLADELDRLEREVRQS
ncbi:hypothetical protein HDA32_004768 [Spinactinospora alkalitolerans]|uniref:DUF4350 domain-containing protein n=1 Tax=Spinactinospora alkalitolerans TaxID=687207 RepID=A0A852U0C8_9ACTN|nr:DUF4350 domain-containing protein [Spinactinospora alkalitolerans]NYE49648.1 hypothetical protein [Spinactinospora alkalitolerans]